MSTELQQVALKALNEVGSGPFLDMRTACTEGRGTYPAGIQAKLAEHGIDFTEEAIHQYSTAVVGSGYSGTIIDWACAKEPVKELLRVTCPKKRGVRRKEAHISMSSVLNTGKVTWLCKDEDTGVCATVETTPSDDDDDDGMVSDKSGNLKEDANLDTNLDANLAPARLFARVQQMMNKSEYREQMAKTESSGKCAEISTGSSEKAIFPDTVFMYNKDIVSSKYGAAIDGDVEAFLGGMKNTLFKERGISVYLDADLPKFGQKASIDSAEVWVHPGAPIRPGLHGSASVKYDPTSYPHVMLFNEAVHRVGMDFESAKYIAMDDFTGDFIELLRIAE